MEFSIKTLSPETAKTGCVVLGIFDHRLHAYRGRSVTHLHDDHMIIDAESRAFAKDHALPYFRAGIVEHPLKELCRVYVSKSIDCEY